MRAFGLGGTEAPAHVEDGRITNLRSRAGPDRAHVKLVGFEASWFDCAHFSDLSGMRRGAPDAPGPAVKDHVATRLVTHAHNPGLAVTDLRRPSQRIQPSDR